MGVWSRVQGSGFRVQSSGFRVQGFGEAAPDLPGVRRLNPPKLPGESEGGREGEGEGGREGGPPGCLQVEAPEASSAARPRFVQGSEEPHPGVGSFINH